MKLLSLILLAVLGFALWVRLAPSDPARWHVSAGDVGNRDFAGAVIRMIPAGPGDMARLDRIIRATPRTTLLAGSPEEGMVTYITRSRLWGFPDYTTIEARAGSIVIHGRLRFGSSDMGVNRARVEGWIAALDSGRA
ncbi:MAG: DUF1499 domain-containing protein [Rhodobacterales bacterium]|nr:DUF1499 domain-containing protein [Rhodobacterales bacterium]MDX5411909.1 DUF1499 domain-containing protein [Rhodobacterales bacterium]